MFGHVFQNNGMKNTITSPLSMYACIAMLAEGSSGQTFAELANVFGYTTEAEVFDSDMLGALLSLYGGGSKGAIIKMCNMIYASKSCPLKDSYTKAVANRHRAAAENVEFADPQTILKINQKIEQSTNGLIINCIKQLDPLTVCVLINTIYFKGNWKKQFDKTRTKPDIFTLANGTTENVDFMNGKIKSATFMTETSTYLSLPYEGDRVKFVVELPKNRKLGKIDIDAVIKTLSASHNGEVNVSLPKFKFRFRVELLPTLNQLGVKRVVNGEGLEKMADCPIRLSQVIHEAFIQVDEEGTEAAAVTVAGMMKCKSVMTKPREFKANSPFYFHIVDSTTNTIMFTGAVQKPEFK